MSKQLCNRSLGTGTCCLPISRECLSVPRHYSHASSPSITPSNRFCTPPQSPLLVCGQFAQSVVPIHPQRPCRTVAARPAVLARSAQRPISQSALLVRSSPAHSPRPTMDSPLSSADQDRMQGHFQASAGEVVTCLARIPKSGRAIHPPHPSCQRRKSRAAHNSG